MTNEQLLNNYDVYLKLTKTKKIYVGICQKGKKIIRTDKTSWTKDWAYKLDYSNSAQRYILYHNGFGYSGKGISEDFQRAFDETNNYILNLYATNLLTTDNCFKISDDDIKLMLIGLYLKENISINEELEYARRCITSFISCPIEFVEKTEQNTNKTTNNNVNNNNNNSKLFLLI